MGKTLGSLTAVAAALLAPMALPGTPASADSAVCSAKKCAFVTPNRTVCVMSPDNAGCGWTDGEKLYAVKLFPNGGLDPCLHLLEGYGKKCDTYSPSGLPALGYGQPAVLGPFTCLVDAASVTCTASPSGRGFTINSAGVIPAQAAPPPPPPDSAVPQASPAPDVAPAPVDEPLILPPPEDMPPPVLPGPDL